MTLTTEATERQYDPVSLAPIAFWAKSPEEREKDYAVLRELRPISWHPPAEGSMMPPQQPGFWAVTRHADIVTVSKDAETFCSGEGITMEDIPSDILEAVSSFLATDAPRHTKLRKLVSAAFTPKRVKKIEDQIRNQAVRLVDQLIETGDCDFVEQISARLPQWTIFEMVGVEDQESRDLATKGAVGMVSWGDEEVLAGREPAELLTESLMALINVALDLAEARRAEPRDDLMTNLVQAEVDGEQLTDEEIAAFFCLLSVAGNDTTRNTTSAAMRALTVDRDQRALLREDFDGRIGPAIDEFVRWASPVMTFRRTATRDVELGGQLIREGEWVVLFYPSGNRDPEVFDDPMRFDITRSPNPHVGFGGGGPHFCMGNQLAKSQLRAIFSELLTRVPDIEVDEPVYLAGNFMQAIKSMPCRLNL
ncbi:MULTISPECIES: cytochrome P450 [unclassified Pseudonocardia]|uniref:cytochrome P450 n=1 Tax=unclassified Pseudonocardia TaxID=2619320 RepID=UPI0001FFDDF3|nr:cytochrome P450 [Pseudonocardia sp. Ae707_Ps1]OLM16777.1 putative cytochrome P450 hydroxylase [Pseudonocardia sp. Ae707_Ps1]